MKIAFIGAGPMTGIFAQKAKEMGYTTLCFAWAEGAEARNDVDAFYDISIFEEEEITSICKKEEVDAIIPTTELTLSVSAHITEALGLPGNPAVVMENITKKNYVRIKLDSAEATFHQPKFVYIKTADEIPDELPFGYPVIVKPAAEGGKRGINVAYDEKDLKSGVKEAFSKDRFQNGVIVEEFLNGGKEYSVEMLSFDGEHQMIQITEKKVSGPPHCVELGHSQPAQLSNETRDIVKKGSQELLTLVGYQNGAAHIEIKIIDEKVYLIELNARTGGDHISYPLVELSTGYDYIGEIIHAALGIKPVKKNENKVSKCAGVRFVTEQTAYLKPIFDICEEKTWCYEKHFETDDLSELTGNNCYHINYFIYCADCIPDEIEE